jgi:hypothetical protein
MEVEKAPSDVYERKMVLEIFLYGNKLIEHFLFVNYEIFLLEI